ncbi:MAG: CoB--CoM heterodisulfide reductase subunit B [Thermoplasmata archaeon]
MTYALFLGCVAPNRYPGIESATREILKVLGVEFAELDGASCCPAPGVTRSFHKNTWLTIGARNLAIAEKNGNDILVICNGCYGSLFEAAHMLHDEKKREEINKNLAEIGMKYEGKTKVRHFVDVLMKEVGVEKIASKVKNQQDKLKVAVHYGCHFLKPHKLKGIEDSERPTILDKLVEATGAKSVDYMDKNLCCGAGGGVRARVPDLALSMTKQKLENIEKAGANIIVNPCPFCHLQYDRGQKDLEWKNKIPVLHLSQLYGLALGVDEKKLGFDMHATPVKLPS